VSFKKLLMFESLLKPLSEITWESLQSLQ